MTYCGRCRSSRRHVSPPSDRLSTHRDTSHIWPRKCYCGSGSSRGKNDEYVLYVVPYVHVPIPECEATCVARAHSRIRSSGCRQVGVGDTRVRPRDRGPGHPRLPGSRLLPERIQYMDMDIQYSKPPQLCMLMTSSSFINITPPRPRVPDCPLTDGWTYRACHHRERKPSCTIVKTRARSRQSLNWSHCSFRVVRLLSA